MISNISEIVNKVSSCYPWNAATRLARGLTWTAPFSMNLSPGPPWSPRSISYRPAWRMRLSPGQTQKSALLYSILMYWRSHLELTHSTGSWVITMGCCGNEDLNSFFRSKRREVGGKEGGGERGEGIQFWVFHVLNSRKHFFLAALSSVKRKPFPQLSFLEQHRLLGYSFPSLTCEVHIQVLTLPPLSITQAFAIFQILWRIILID